MSELVQCIAKDSKKDPIVQEWLNLKCGHCDTPFDSIWRSDVEEDDPIQSCYGHHAVCKPCKGYVKLGYIYGGCPLTCYWVNKKRSGKELTDEEMDRYEELFNEQYGLKQEEQSEF